MGLPVGDDPAHTLESKATRLFQLVQDRTEGDAGLEREMELEIGLRNIAKTRLVVPRDEAPVLEQTKDVEIRNLTELIFARLGRQPHGAMLFWTKSPIYHDP